MSPGLFSVSRLIILRLASFPYKRKLGVFHWSLRDNKSLHVSKTLLSILADYFTSYKFSIPELAGGLLLDSGRQQVSSSLQDSS